VPATVAVIGAGVVGLATSAALLEAGASVWCFEALGPMTQRSTGGTRIFRLAHGRPELVELAQRARRIYQLWSPNLVGTEGTLVSRPDAESWAEAMRAAGAEVEMREGLPGLPDGNSGWLAIPGLDRTPVLTDPAGGVINAAEVGRFLLGRVDGNLEQRAVTGLEPTPRGLRVHTAERAENFDAAVIVAGAGTAALAAQVGLDVRTPLVHHVRFTFAMRDPALHPPCLLDRTEGWRPGFTTYQHRTAPGRWAIGAHPEQRVPADVEAVDKTAATSAAREVTARYVRQTLPWLRPEPGEQVYCDPPQRGGDGYLVRRAGRALCLYGDNLFKFAPVLGVILAEAAIDGSLPESFPPVR
jgi:sarcosine oxidase